MSSLKYWKQSLKISKKSVKAKLGEDIEKQTINFKNESMNHFDFDDNQQLEKNTFLNEQVESFVQYNAKYEAIILATKMEVRVTVVTEEKIEDYLFNQTNIHAGVDVAEKYVIHHHHKLQNLWEYIYVTPNLSMKFTIRFEIVNDAFFNWIERLRIKEEPMDYYLQSMEIKQIPNPIQTFKGELKDSPTLKQWFKIGSIESITKSEVQNMKFSKSNIANNDIMKIISELPDTNANINIAGNSIINKRRATLKSHFEMLFHRLNINSDSFEDLKNVYEVNKQCIAILKEYESTVEELIMFVLSRILNQKTSEL